MTASVPTVVAEFDRSRLTWVERGLRAFTDVRPGEGRTALLMFANVFLILCAYYFIKPLREGWLAVSQVKGLTPIEVRAYTYFAQSMLLIPVVSYYGRLVERLPRPRLIERATLFCIANMAVFWLLAGLGQGGPAGAVVGVVFYLWVGMFSVFVVAQFWAFAADLYTEERGNRLLPLIAIGATSGAVVGAWLVDELVGSGLFPTRHLMLISMLLLGISLWLTRTADRTEGSAPKRFALPGIGASPDLDRRSALRLVFGVRYLLAVGVIMLLANWVRTNGDNQLYAEVQRVLAAKVNAQGITSPDAVRAFGKEGTTAFFGSFYFWLNVVALGLQAFAASRILKYGGFASLFLLMPVVAFVSYSAIAILPALALMKAAQATVNATDYSIQNTARHVLWLPMSREVTFKGKPTIDSLFVRAGDGMAAATVLVGVQLFSSTSRSFFILNVLLVGIWLAAAAWVVREHGRLRETTHGGGEIHGLSEGGRSGEAGIARSNG